MLAAVAGYELDVDRGPDWLWIRIRSCEADCEHASSLSEQLMAIIDKHFVYRVVLELHGIPELSSDLIGELGHLSRQIRKHGGVLRVCGLSSGSRTALEICGLDDLCLAYDTREEAIVGCCDPRRPR